MTTTPESIVNPAMGARARFVRPVPGAAGALLEIDFELDPGGVIAVEHVHPLQQESFVVVSGEVTGTVGGRPRTLGEGGRSVVPPGVPHAWRNASAQRPLRLRVSFRPALRTEEFFRVAFALAAAGRADAHGVPRLADRLALMAAFPREFRPAALPVPVHAVLVRVLAPWGRRLLRAHGLPPTGPSTTRTHDSTTGRHA